MASLTGGFNKMMRNLVAGASDTEFEKRLTKCTFHLDSKEPKEKHVIYLLECLNGEHKDQVSPLGSLKFIFERLISNLDNWAINLKVLIVFHRALQNIKVNRKIYKDLKSKEHLLHPYQSKKADANYQVKMYCEISRQYANYVKFYCNIANKTDILAKSMQKISDDVAQLKTADILKHYEYFEALIQQIFAMFQHSNFCRQTRLGSNLIFMCFKDLIKIYKVYYVHITEILERFPGLSASEAEKGFVMYQNFVNLTDSIKTKANKLVYLFNFPIQLPDFYNPERGLVDTLKVVVEEARKGNANGMVEFSKKLRGGMNRDQFQTKQDKQNDDGDKEYYFDCAVLDKMQAEQANSGQGGNANPFGAEEAKGGAPPLDLMDFISKSDFSTVGGQTGQNFGNNNAGLGGNNNASDEAQFQQFLTGQGASGGANNMGGGGQSADLFFGGGDSQPAQNNNGGGADTGLSKDLSDIFGAAAQQSANPLNDIFGAGSSQPLAPSNNFMTQQPVQNNNNAMAGGDIFGGMQQQQQQPGGQNPQQQQQQVNQQQNAFQPMAMGGNPFQTQQQMPMQQQQQMQQQPFQPMGMQQQQQPQQMNMNAMGGNQMGMGMGMGQPQQQQQQPPASNDFAFNFN